MTQGNGEIPEFKSEYIPAFCGLMLHKLGGMQQITLELLKKFPKKDIPVIDWRSENKSFVMATPQYITAKKRKRGLVLPKRKLILRD